MNHFTFFYVIAAMQVLDVVTTLYAIRHPWAREGNPVLVKLFKVFGPAPTLVVFKAAFLAAVWVFPIPVWAQVALIGIYAFILVNNFKLIRKHRKG